MSTNTPVRCPHSGSKHTAHSPYSSDTWSGGSAGEGGGGSGNSCAPDDGVGDQGAGGALGSTLPGSPLPLPVPPPLVLTLLVLADSLELGCEEEDEPVKLLNQPIAAGGGTMQSGGRNELGFKGKGFRVDSAKILFSLKNFSPRRGAALGFVKLQKT